jgi:hypothetical protein
VRDDIMTDEDDFRLGKYFYDKSNAPETRRKERHPIFKDNDVWLFKSNFKTNTKTN